MTVNAAVPTTRSVMRCALVTKVAGSSRPRRGRLRLVVVIGAPWCVG
jgi:hypothetical protein